MWCWRWFFPVIYRSIWYLGIAHLEVQKERKRNKKPYRKFWYAVAGCMVLCGLVAFGFGCIYYNKTIFAYRYMIPALDVSGLVLRFV